MQTNLRNPSLPFIQIRQPTSPERHRNSAHSKTARTIMDFTLTRPTTSPPRARRRAARSLAPRFPRRGSIASSATSGASRPAGARAAGSRRATPVATTIATRCCGRRNATRSSRAAPLSGCVCTRCSRRAATTAGFAALSPICGITRPPINAHRSATFAARPIALGASDIATSSRIWGELCPVFAKSTFAGANASNANRWQRAADVIRTVTIIAIIISCAIRRKASAEAEITLIHFAWIIAHRTARRSLTFRRGAKAFTSLTASQMPARTRTGLARAARNFAQILDFFLRTAHRRKFPIAKVSRATLTSASATVRTAIS